MPEISPSPEPKTVALPETIVIKELADKLKLPVTKVIGELMKNGIMSGQNERIDYDTAAVIAQDFGFTTTQEAESEEGPDTSVLEAAAQEEAAHLQPRPPVVVVMGHVDHGKTKLLDAIRSTNVVDEEAGGITQRVGAYQVTEKGRTITFIDTPGHEAFSAMRSRGARVADVAILVVAADDGVKPQTKEALDIITKSRIPFVVAINKIDKPEANVDRVKQQLSELNVLGEDWGGKTVMAPVSAKEKTGLTELLDVVLLVAELEKESLKANPDRSAIGTIIESHIDPGEGPVATVLVQTGTLRPGDLMSIGNIYGKVKALKDYRGQTISSAGPATPARIIGLKGAPAVGDILQVVSDLSDVKKRVKNYQLKSRTATTTVSATAEVQSTEENAKGAKVIPVVLKADTLGSLEAITGALEVIRNDEVAVKIIQKGLGNITEADVLAAETGKAQLFGFNVALTPSAEAVAKGKDISTKLYSIIYDLVDEVRAHAESLLTPEVIVTELGKLKILAVFRTERSRMIVGGQVTSGKAVHGSRVRITRNGETLAIGTVTQLQTQKRDVKEVQSGAECGMKIECSPVIAVGDTLEFYSEEIRKKSFGA